MDIIESQAPLSYNICRNSASSSLADFFGKNLKKFCLGVENCKTCCLTIGGPNILTSHLTLWLSIWMTAEKLSFGHVGNFDGVIFL